MMFGRVYRRLRYVRYASQRARLLREEMDIHLQMKTQELMEDGMSESDARSAARRQFGNLSRQQEESRGTWIARWLSDLVQDAKFAGRTLAKQPGFAGVASLSAALGIGACSLIFGLANHALLRQLPVENPSQLVSVSGINRASGKVGTSLTYPDFQDLSRAGAFQGMTAYFPFMPGNISLGNDPQRYWGSIATANYFNVVRPSFALGRGFDASKDDLKGETPVVVLSHKLWRSLFNADRNILGRNIQLNGRTVTVIGVTEAGFRGTEALFFSDFWIPFSMSDMLAQVGIGGDRLHDRGGQWLSAVGRLRDEATPKTAAVEVSTLGARLRAAYPSTNKDREFHLEGAGQVPPIVRKITGIFFALLVAVAILVLCTACANVANLLLARASARQKEIATRLAIGAGRGRLIRQLLTESVMLALLGGVGGYGIAQLGVSMLAHARIPMSVPVDLSISLDYRVMLFCMLLSTASGVFFGLVPALRATRPELVSGLKDESVRLGGFRRFGLRNILVVAQVTICMVLLVCSGLFLRSLVAAGNIDPGFTNRNLLLVAFDPSLNGSPAHQVQRNMNAILERTGAIPGVESATLSSSVPLKMEGTQNGFIPDHQLGLADAKPIIADVYSVTPRFFETFGIRLIDGQDFRSGTAADQGVIVNQALADRAFPKQNPIGRRISYLGRMVQISGVVATTKSRTIGEDPPHPCLYFPMERDLQGNDSLTGMTLVLRTRGKPESYIPAAREIIRSVDPRLAVSDIRTMDMQLSQALFVPRAAAFIFGIAGAMGILIATVGIYGVISFGVARQTKEIGVRIALGAKRSQVVGIVLKNGLMLTLVGSVLGLGVALALGRTAASLLYGVSPTDALTFVLAPMLLLAVTCAACLGPARRAASLDPIRALRYE